MDYSATPFTIVISLFCSKSIMTNDEVGKAANPHVLRFIVAAVITSMFKHKTALNGCVKRSLHMCTHTSRDKNIAILYVWVFI